MNKKVLAGQLKEVAKLNTVLQRDEGISKAYNNAARALDNYDGDFEALVEKGQLTSLWGISNDLALDIMMALQDGVLPSLVPLREETPAGVQQLLNVRGLGPSKVRTLWDAGIDTPQSLVDAHEDNALQALKGFGKKSAETAAASAQFGIEARTRMRLDEAAARTISLAKALLGALPDATVDAAGEYRRRLETVASVDLASTADTQAISQALSNLGIDHEILGSIAWGTHDDRPFRIFSGTPETYGTTLLLATGGTYLEHAQEAADTLGFTPTSTGLIGPDGPIATPTERDAFRTLGVPFVEPEQRDNKHATPNPTLVTPDAIRGVIHNHTRWSDGTESVLGLAEACIDLGYAYLGIADHSRRSSYANGLSIDRLTEQADDVLEANATLKSRGDDFVILHGAEVDILPDGSLDYPDDILATLDYCVISIHQEFQLSLGKQTDRMIAAIHHPLSDILGHPTGRLLLARPGYDIDLDAVIDACIETGTVIEINAKPHRLDLDWRWVRIASERGATFSINPDAHTLSDLSCIPFGVAAARKASLSTQRVITTEPTAETFLARLKRHQRRT